MAIDFKVTDLKFPSVVPSADRTIGTAKATLLTAVEQYKNLTLPFILQKNKEVSVGSTAAQSVGTIEYDGTIVFTGASVDFTLTLPQPINAGFKITVINATSKKCTITWTGRASTDKGYTVYAGRAQEYVQSATRWYQLGSPTYYDSTNEKISLS